MKQKFIIYIINKVLFSLQSSQELETTIENRREVMQRVGLSLQPFIIIVGKRLAEITSFYVVIDDVIYKTKSTLAALDLCFKAIYILHASYPRASERLWTTIHKRSL